MVTNAHYYTLSFFCIQVFTHIRLGVREGGGHSVTRMGVTPAMFVELIAMLAKVTTDFGTAAEQLEQ